MEVLVAMAVLLLSLVGLTTLTNMASNRAIEVRQQSWAIQRCQAKMAEVVAGAVALSSQSDQPFTEDSDWVWSLDAQDAGVTGLWNVTVRVSRQGTDGSRVETTLSQMVLDPALRGRAPAASAEASSGATSGSTTSGTTPSSSSGTGR